jgi:hypothetical protein
VIERVRENYAERDRSAVQVRLIAWTERTSASASLTRLRQQRHRLRESVRPRERAPAEADPWLIAFGTRNGRLIAFGIYSQSAGYPYPVALR